MFAPRPPRPGVPAGSRIEAEAGKLSSLRPGPGQAEPGFEAAERRLSSGSLANPLDDKNPRSGPTSFFPFTPPGPIPASPPSGLLSLLMMRALCRPRPAAKTTAAFPPRNASRRLNSADPPARRAASMRRPALRFSVPFRSNIRRSAARMRRKPDESARYLRRRANRKLDDGPRRHDKQPCDKTRSVARFGRRTCARQAGRKQAEREGGLKAQRSAANLIRRRERKAGGRAPPGKKSPREKPWGGGGKKTPSAETKAENNAETQNAKRAGRRREGSRIKGSIHPQTPREEETRAARARLAPECAPRPKPVKGGERR